VFRNGLRACHLQVLAVNLRKSSAVSYQETAGISTESDKVAGATASILVLDAALKAL